MQQIKAAVREDYALAAFARLGGYIGGLFKAPELVRHSV
jgi:hypothetical protein